MTEVGRESQRQESVVMAQYCSVLVMHFTKSHFLLIIVCLDVLELSGETVKSVNLLILALLLAG